jgi:hypothetical protein
MVEARCRAEIEARLIATLSDGPRVGETYAVAFQRKEHELGELFATLTPIELLALERRLTMPAQDDELAARFSRLVVERRKRLLAFLARARTRR